MAPNDESKNSPFETTNGAEIEMVELGDESYEVTEGSLTNVSDAIRSVPSFVSPAHYDDYETIDWIRDTILARRQKAMYKRDGGGKGCFGKFKMLLYKSQGWLLLFLIAVAIACIASILNVSVEYMVDTRLGYCTTGFFLSRKLCCRLSESDVLFDTCDAWHNWAKIVHLETNEIVAYIVNWFFYVVISIIYAGLSAFMVKNLIRWAAGSGIPEVKVILGGFVIKMFNSWQSLIVKVTCLILSAASGLNLGKEGPMIHVASATAEVISSLFPKYALNEVKKREILAAASGVGITVAFGAPLGGVLISLEELSYYFPHHIMLSALFCSTIAASVLQLLNPFHNGKLIIYQVHYFHSWLNIEWIPFIFIGIFMGFLGALFIKLNIRWSKFRRTSRMKLFPITYVMVMAGITAFLSWCNVYLRSYSSDFLAGMFSQCEGGDITPLCDPERTWTTVSDLFIAGTVRFLLTVFTFGLAVPSGLFIPGFAIGATFGRVVGIISAWAYNNIPESYAFETCKNHAECIDPSVYAIIGAACFLTGATRATFSIIVIILEATGDLNYLLPVTIAVLVSKFVGDLFSKEGIYEEIILMNEYPFLNNRVHYNFRKTAKDIMVSRHLSIIELQGNTYGSLMAFMNSNNHTGWPVVTSKEEMSLIGYITRSELRQALAFAGAHRVVQDNTNCYFSPEIPSSENRPYIDLVPWMDATPIQVVPNTPLNNVFDMFTRMGMRYVLVANRGTIVGIVTKKDILQYIHVEYHAKGKHSEEDLDDEDDDLSSPTSQAFH
eukprot:TRINITY_DN509_c0_g1_i8.p1 TRINITY_DN509_c0_g1~~TRINITY_DN509_c0_g1_i8.p1  ORF type:complete len:779 (+),score=347.52 TRINITY_DN509_c0_g1_i8:298-2634(+)